MECYTMIPEGQFFIACLCYGLSALIIGGPDPGQRIGLPARTYAWIWDLLCISPLLLAGISIINIWTLSAGIIISLVILRDLRLRAAERRAQQATEALIHHLSVIVACLRAGQLQSDIPIEATDPVGQYLYCALARIREGASPKVVFAQSLDRSIDKDLEHLGALWAAGSRYGIALSGLLEQHLHGVTVRRDYGRLRKAQSQGGLMSARILMALPLLGISLGGAMGARPFAFLLGGGLGGLLLVVGSGLASLGYIWAHHIISTGRILR